MAGDGAAGREADRAGPEERPGRISSEVLYDGRIVRLSLDRVRFPDGTTGDMELVRHSGAAAVLPLLDEPDAEDPEILLVRQYRYAAAGDLYEVPAGLPAGPDEDWESCARRELEEETGHRAAELRRLTRIHTTPGFTDEQVHLFLATGLTGGTARRDDDEFLRVVRLPFSRALEMVRDGEITDGKSVAILLYAATFLRGG